MRLNNNNYWSLLISLLVENYFSNLTTTCILGNRNFDFGFKSANSTNTVFLQINPRNLNKFFESDIFNFSLRKLQDQRNEVYYNDLTLKLIAAIEQTHCEGFLAFQDDIHLFAKAFRKASRFSIWRPLNNRFLLAFTKDQQKQDFFQDQLFKDQANILVIEADSWNSTEFYLKTNKFVGQKQQNPHKLIYLSTFFGFNKSFIPDIDLFSTRKLENLQGRELVIGAFDYRPFVAVDFEQFPQYYDHACDNPSHQVHVDGTEIRIAHTFCEIYNCTLQFDTSEKEEWGITLDNYTSNGLIGMIIDDRIDMAMGAMYALVSYYKVVESTSFIGRSGVTCLVPSASALASWNLPLRPFHLNLWLTILLSLSLEAFGLSMLRKFEQYFRVRTINWHLSFNFGFATILKLVLNQSSNYKTQTHAIRTFLVACYMFEIIVNSVYGGGLSSVLTIPTFGESADSVERLYKFNLTWTGSSYAWLESISGAQTQNDPIYSHLLNNFEVNSIEDMRLKAKTHNMAFIIERLTYGHFGGGDFLSPEALRRLKLMLEDIYFQYTVTMVSRSWPYLPKYNDFLMMWLSAGLDKYWEWRMTAKYLNLNEQTQVLASKYHNVDLGPTKLNLDNFAGIIVMWLVGMLLSIVTFGIEILWFELRLGRC